MAYNPSDNVYLLVCDGTSGLCAWFVDAKGTFLGEKQVVWKGSNAIMPAVAWNSILGKFIIVWVVRNPVHDDLMITTFAPKQE